MTTKKKNPFKKKQEVKKSVQPKKEYKTVVIKPKKEVVSDPDKSMSVCLTRDQIFRIKTKMHTDERLVEYFESVLA